MLQPVGKMLSFAFQIPLPKLGNQAKWLLLMVQPLIKGPLCKMGVGAVNAGPGRDYSPFSQKKRGRPTMLGREGGVD